MKKFVYTTADGRITTEFEASNDKDAFRKLSSFQEIYEDTPSAVIDGKLVSGGNVSYRTRRSKYTDPNTGKEKEAEFFEKVVTDGPLQWFKKTYGVLDDGTDNLFPKRPTPDEVEAARNRGDTITLGHNGWHKYSRGRGSQ
jgi:hypothetical protein